MANLILTNTCNMRCPFCFASESRVGEDAGNAMKVTDFWRLSQKFSIDTVRFCGGEPTLHPQFPEMLSAVLAGGSSAFIMTNGLWPERVRDFFASLPAEQSVRVRFLFNVLPPGLYSAQQRQSLKATLGVISPANTCLGLTLYSPSQDYQYIVQMAVEHDVPRIRYSVAAPNLGDPRSRLLEPTSDFVKMAPLVHGLIMDARAAGIRTEIDCGYLPPCFFTKEQLGDILGDGNSHALRFTCSDSPIDIGTDGSVWRCYGLYSLLNSHESKFKSAKDVRGYFDRHTRLLDGITLYEECVACEHRASGLCGGGCYVYRVAQVMRENPEAQFFPIGDDAALLECKPAVLGSVAVWRRDRERSQVVVGRTRLIEGEENVLSFLDACDGRTSLKEMVDLWKDNFDSEEETRDEVLGTARVLFEADVITFVTGLDVKKRLPLYGARPVQRVEPTNGLPLSVVDPAGRTVQGELLSATSEGALVRLPEEPAGATAGYRLFLGDVSAQARRVFCKTRKSSDEADAAPERIVAYFAFGRDAASDGATSFLSRAAALSSGSDPSLST